MKKAARKRNAALVTLRHESEQALVDREVAATGVADARSRPLRPSTDYGAMRQTTPGGDDTDVE